jgi:hypothetical protein
LTTLLAAAEGRFPPVDGGVTFVEPLTGGREAIVGFTGHAVVATALDPGYFDDLDLDGFGQAFQPEVMLRLARGGTVHSNDVTLVAAGTGGPDHPATGGASPLPATDRWDQHPRARLARSIRQQVRVHGDESGFVTISRGLAGRTEMGVEVRNDLQGAAAGGRLIKAARRLVPHGQWLFAAVAPGNARSLRAFLAAGFVPLGTEVLIEPGTPGP